MACRLVELTVVVAIAFAVALVETCQQAGASASGLGWNVTSMSDNCVGCLHLPFGRSIPVLFVKTHKTGSSTVTGVLWRALCVDLGVNCFLPPANRAGRIWDLKDAKDKEFLLTSKGTNHSIAPYDAWVHHLHYSPGVHCLVKAPHLLVATVRRPAERFESAWYWYGLQETVGMSIKSFAQSYDPLTRDVHKKWKHRMGLDATAEELTGLSALDSPGYFATAFKALLTRVGAHQMFLFVTDRFDESMLVLRRLLRFRCASRCPGAWMYVPQKVRPRAENGTGTLDTAELKRLDDLQPHDSRLFRAANAALDELIKWYGPRFTADLLVYRAELAATRARCQDAEAHTRSGVCVALHMDNREAVTTFWVQRAGS